MFPHVSLRRWLWRNCDSDLWSSDLYVSAEFFPWSFLSHVKQSNLLCIRPVLRCSVTYVHLPTTHVLLQEFSLLRIWWGTGWMLSKSADIESSSIFVAWCAPNCSVHNTSSAVSPQSARGVVHVRDYFQNWFVMDWLSCLCNVLCASAPSVNCNPWKWRTAIRFFHHLKK